MSAELRRTRYLFSINDLLNPNDETRAKSGLDVQSNTDVAGQRREEGEKRNPNSIEGRGESEVWIDGDLNNKRRKCLVYTYIAVFIAAVLLSNRNSAVYMRN